MALELGLKLKNATSVSELRISKSTLAPVFVSTETHSSFILTCFLKGYDRNSFQIKISEDGREICISGEKPVQEMLMKGRVVLKKNVQIVGFRKVFEIPNGVVLDLIKAKFDEDGSLLKIVMPKLVKGICGVQIQEVKKQEFGESSKKDSSETGENECVCRKEEKLSDKKPVESIEGTNGTTREDEFEATRKEEIGKVEFGNGDKDEEKVPTKMSKKGFEAMETSKEEEESKKVFDGKDKAVMIEQRELEEPESETEDRGEQKEETEETKLECEGEDDEERLGAKISKEGIDTAMERREPEKELPEAFGINGEDIIQGKHKKEIEKSKFERESKDKDRVGTKISKGGLEAIIDTSKEEKVSEDVLAGAIRVDGKGKIDKNKQREVEEAKLETEGKDEKMEGRETTTKEAIEIRMEGVEPTKVGDEKIEVGKEGLVKGIEQKEIEYEDGERVEDKVGGRQKRDIQRLESETSKEGLEAIDTTTKGAEYEMGLAGSVRVSGQDMEEDTKHRESEAAECEIKGKDEEKMGTKNNMKGLEATEGKMEGGVSKKVSVGKIGVSEEDRVEGTEQRETDETKFEIEDRDKEKVREVLKGPQEKEIEKTEFAIEGRDEERVRTEIKEEFEAKDATIEGGVSEAAGISEKEIVEAMKKGEIGVPKFENEGRDKEMLKEEYEARKTKIKESPTQEPKLSIQLEESEGKKLKEVEEPKFQGVEKDSKIPECATSKGEKLEEIEEATETMAKRRSQEAEGILEKVEEEPKMSKDASKVDGNDYARDPTKKDIEETRDGQHGVQELPMKIAESVDEREGPKDTETEETQKDKRKSEKTQVVADEESTIEEKIRDAKIERFGKNNQFEKSLQQVPEAKDREALRKDVRERETMLSTQQAEVKEIDKVCEECKRSEANVEREKWRTTEGFKDESMQKSNEKEHPGKSQVEKEVEHLEERVPYLELRKEVETKYDVEAARLKELPPPKLEVKSLDIPLESEKKDMKWKSPKTKKLAPEAREGEEYEAGKPPEVKSSPSTQQSIVDEEKFKIDFPKSNTSMKPSEEKEIEALQPNVLSDQNLEGKEHFKTSTEDRGHYLLDTEKRLEAKKVAEEEDKTSQKDEAETLSCKRERTKIAACKDEKRKTKRNGSEEINQSKAAAEEFRDVLADNETRKSPRILLHQTVEIQGKEKISEIRGVEEEKSREIPFHVSQESEAVISNIEAESQKPIVAHPKGEVDKLSKGPSKTSRPGVTEDDPTVKNFPHFQEVKESTSSLEGTKTSEIIANEFDKPPAEKSVAEEGEKDECCDGRHQESQEPEKHESELDFQESTRRRSDQEVEKTHFSQQEENHEGHAIAEAENVAHVEISQESEDLEDIKVEASEKKVELCTPLVFAGSVFIASLIIFFLGRKGAQKR